MIYELTKEQEAKIPLYKKKWHDKFFSLGFDREKAFKFVDWLYSLMDRKPPVKIVLDSPFSVQLAANILYSQLSSQLYSQLRSQLDYAQIRYHPFDIWGDTSWYGYLCFYDFLYNEVFKDVKIPIFEKYLALQGNINFLLTFEKVAFISKPPVFINFDEQNRLHCTNDCAVYYNDGYGLHFVHGVYFEPELFQKFFRQEFKGKEVLKLENAEQKATIIQEFGFDKIFKSIKNKRIIDSQMRLFNRQKDKPVNYVLYEAEVVKGVKSHVLKLEWYEGERKRQTVLGVPNTIDDAIEAVAWTCHKTKEEWENKLLKEA